jgi:methylmalonyl-CoA mutase
MITGLEAGSVSEATRDVLLCDGREGEDRRPLGGHRHRRRGQELAHRRIVRRFRRDQQDRLRIAIISIDPSRRKSAGALLGRPHSE